MSTANLLDELMTQGVELDARGDKLEVVAPRQALTPQLVATLKQHKAELLAWLRHAGDTGNTHGKGLSPDRIEKSSTTSNWNDLPNSETIKHRDFDNTAMLAIKSGSAVRVWSAVLNEWLWWVRGEHERRKLVAGGCRVPIYTLGELAVVAEWNANELRDVHRFKREFGAKITRLDVDNEDG